METTLETTAPSHKDMHSDLGRELVDIKKVLEAQGCSKDEVKKALMGMLGVPYVEATAITREDSATPPARWLRFLEETVGDQKAIDFLQEFFGYCLSRSTKYSIGLVLEGPGFGKSVMLEVLRKTVGEEYCAAIPLARLGSPVCRAALYNKLVNISHEIDPRVGNAGSTYFKALITGDPIFGALSEDSTPFEFTPFCKLVIATSKLPSPSYLDQDSGWHRRLRTVNFIYQRDPELCDHRLISVLTKELSAIRKWAEKGLKRLRAQQGFTESHGF